MPPLRTSDGSKIDLIQDWRNPPKNRICASRYGTREVNVHVEDEADVWVTIYDDKTDTIVRRTFPDITKCHLCKLHIAQSSANAIDSEHSVRAPASSHHSSGPRQTRSPSLAASLSSSGTIKSSKDPPPDCLYCASRLERYIFKFNHKVRHTLRMGYAAVYRPIHIPQSAPGAAIAAVLVKKPAAPAPVESTHTEYSDAQTRQEAVDKAYAVGIADHRDELRRTLCLAKYTCEYEAIQNIIFDAQVDIDLGHSILDRLRCDVEVAHAELSPSRQLLLVRRFGSRMFSGSRPLRLDLLALLEKEGWGPMSLLGLADWETVRGILMKGSINLKEMRRDIRNHEKAMKKAAHLAKGAEQARARRLKELARARGRGKGRRGGEGAHRERGDVGNGGRARSRAAGKFEAGSATKVQARELASIGRAGSASGVAIPRAKQSAGVSKHQQAVAPTPRPTLPLLQASRSRPLDYALATPHDRPVKHKRIEHLRRA